MRVLFVTPESVPLTKTGGLADVSGALAHALGDIDCDVRLLHPAYADISEHVQDFAPALDLPDLFGGPGRLLYGQLSDGLQVLALDAPHLFDRPGNPYLGPDGQDWPDNYLRFAALSWVGSRIALGGVGDWRPDLVHAHDWQAGLTPAYLHFSGEAAPPTVLTIHNLAFQGVFPRNKLNEVHLPEASYSLDGIEYFGQISFLKAGLQYADRLTTVSPTYAREIQTQELGMGLDGVLRQRSDALSGILNGIDDSVWNPQQDPLIDENYGSRSLKRKALNKKALQQRFAIDGRGDSPLFCVVTRLTEQKGMDLVLDVLPEIVGARGQLVVLGSGDPGLEAAFRAAAQQHPGQVGVVIGYDEALSHRIQAGADAILIPSRFEPCGLTQLYGMRYGTLPIVARVGGLADTVIDANEAALQDGVATGFHFTPVTTEPLRWAIQRAFALFANRRMWQTMQRRAMTRQLGWQVRAREYLDLYQELLPTPAVN